MHNMSALLVIVAMASTVFADEASERQQARVEAKSHYTKGVTAFDLGQYDLAITEYEAAYKIINEPSLLYNLGQAHRLARHPSQALHFYRVYLIKVPNASNRVEVETKMRALEASIELEQKTRNMPPDAPRLPEPTRNDPPPITKPIVAPEVKPEPKPEPTAAPVATKAPRAPDRGRTLKIAGGALAGVGLGLAAGGIACTLLANQARSAIADANRNHDFYDPAQYSKFRTNQAVGAALLAVGGVAVVSGVVVVVLGVQRSKNARADRAAHLPSAAVSF